MNSASTPPDVPPLFLWKDAGGNSLVMMYHLHATAACVKIPGSDLAMDVEVRDDNSGPAHHRGNPRHLLGLAKAVSQRGSDGRQPHRHCQCRGALPRALAGGDAGDRRYLDLWRAERSSQGGALPGSGATAERSGLGTGKLAGGRCGSDLAFLSSFLLEVEHTWGTDTKTWLDFDHYTPHDLRRCWTSRSTRWCYRAGRKSGRTCWMRSPRCRRRCARRHGAHAQCFSRANRTLAGMRSQPCG